MKNSFLNDNPELNITPLVDIMLVLLVVMMLIMPSIKYDENITLPNGSKTIKSNIKEKDIQLFITNDNISFNGKKIDFIEFSDNFLFLTNKFSKNTTIYIAGDKSISYEKLMLVLSTFKKAGFSKISLQSK